MRDRFRRMQLFMLHHQEEFAVGLMALSFGLLIRDEVQRKILDQHMYVHVTPEEISALLHNDVSTLTYDVSKRMHVHLVKMNPQ